MLLFGIQVQGMDPWGSARDPSSEAGMGFEDSFSPQDKDQQGEGLLNLSLVCLSVNSEYLQQLTTYHQAHNLI